MRTACGRHRSVLIGLAMWLAVAGLTLVMYLLTGNQGPVVAQ